MKNKIILLFFISVLFSCGKHEMAKSKEKYKSNENLISFNINYNVKDPRFENQNPINLKEFHPEFDTIKYLNGEIHISYLTYVVGCSEYAGDIDIKNDSIVLLAKNIGEESCTEALLARLTYKNKKL